MAVTSAKHIVTMVIVTGAEAAAVSLHQKNRNVIAYTCMMNNKKKGLVITGFLLLLHNVLRLRL